MLARRPFARVVVLDSVVAGDLVAAKLKVTDAPGSPPTYMLAIYRVREGLIQDLWYIASAKQDDAAAAKSAEEVIARFGAANNRGDVEAFLALFSPHAKNFRNSGDLHKLGDKPSVRIVDEKSRRAAYLQMFANGAPAQVQTLGTVALNDMIVVQRSRDLADRQGHRRDVGLPHRERTDRARLVRLQTRRAPDFDACVHAVVEVRQHRADHQVAAGIQKGDGLDAVLRDRHRRERRHLRRRADRVQAFVKHVETERRDHRRPARR